MVPQKIITGWISAECGRERSSMDIVESAIKKWKDEEFLSTGKDWNATNTQLLFRNLEEVSKNKEVARARWITMLMIFNGLPTKSRCCVMERKERRPIRHAGDERLRCELCGSERDDDDIMHLLSRCEVVKNGKRLIFKWLEETSKRMNLEKAGEKRKKIGESKNKGGEERKERKGATVDLESDFFAHLLGRKFNDVCSAMDMCFLNETIWDARCFYSSNRNYCGQDDVPKAMLRMFQEHYGYQEEKKAELRNKKEQKKRKQEWKDEAVKFYYDEKSKLPIRFVRYKIIKGVRVMNRFLTGEHLTPRFDTGEPMRSIYNDITGEQEPFLRYHIENGRAILNPIPKDWIPNWNIKRVSDILHPSIRSKTVCWCFAYPNYPLLNSPNQPPQCRCNYAPKSLVSSMVSRRVRSLASEVPISE